MRGNTVSYANQNTSHGTVAEQSGNGRGRVEEPYQEIKKLRSKENPSSPPSADAASKVSEVIEIWNRTVKGTNLPSARFTEKRHKVINARSKEQGWFEDFTCACSYVRSSDFHRGKNDRNWIASLNFLLQDGRATELAEKAKAAAAGKPIPRNALDYQAELMRQAESGVQQ
jgi:hypothetical protein